MEMTQPQANNSSWFQVKSSSSIQDASTGSAQVASIDSAQGASTSPIQGKPLDYSNDKLGDLKSLFTKAKNILILIRKDPSFDGLAASLGLYLALKKSSREVTIYCETPVIVEEANLIGSDKVTNIIGNKNLVVSFDYQEGQIDKVSYNIEGKKFNLIISPKAGMPALSTSKISYSYSGISGDLIFSVECQKLEDLGKITETQKEFFTKVPIVNIDYHNDSNFAKYNINSPGVLSCAELVLSLFPALSLTIDRDIATNILMGIEYTSASFSDPRLDAVTFETVAYLLKQGAKRQKVPTLKVGEVKKVESSKSREPAQEKPPVDWLQPKIYKGGQLL